MGFMANRWAAICKNTNTKYVTIPAGTKQFFGEMYPRDPFQISEEKVFEGRNLKLTSDYNGYLSKLYGNYMSVPKESEREKHVMLELDREALIDSVNPYEKLPEKRNCQGKSGEI